LGKLGKPRYSERQKGSGGGSYKKKTLVLGCDKGSGGSAVPRSAAVGSGNQLLKKKKKETQESNAECSTAGKVMQGQEDNLHFRAVNQFWVRMGGSYVGKHLKKGEDIRRWTEYRAEKVVQGFK